MKLIAIYENEYSLLANFSVDGQTYFLDWTKMTDEKYILDSNDRCLDFSKNECDDVLVELKKQHNYGRKK